MKYLCIGDTHGKIKLVEKLLTDKFNEFHKVFIGDYVDSFDESVEDQIGIVKLLLNASEREDVTCLIGNHELSYIREGMMCSGFRSETLSHMVHLKEEILEKFKSHMYLDDDILVTHAGATGNLFEDIHDVTQALVYDDPRLYGIGYARGGHSSYGGIYWCDFWREYAPIDGLTQIVGHTAHRPTAAEGAGGIVEMDNCFNIDCLDRVTEALIVDTEVDGDGKFKIINFLTYEGE